VCELDVCLGGAVLLEVDVLAPVIGVNIVPIGGNTAVEVEVVDLRTLKPLDGATVLESVKKTGKLLIVHEDNITGGVGAEVAALAADQAFGYLDAPIARLCGPDVPTMPFAATLEEAYMPNTEKIAAALRKLAAY